MKELRVTFEDNDFWDLKDVKGDRKWRTAILQEFDLLGNYICEYCGKDYDSEQWYVKHIENEHEETEIDE